MPERKLERVLAGALDDFELDRFRLIDAGGREIGVVRTVAGFFALRNSCPHQRAPICAGEVGGTMIPSAPEEREYGLDGEVVRCPWHGWEFHMTDGNALFGTSRKRVVIYPVEVDNGSVYVMVGAVSPGAA
jgi:nitrite reductase/ring-hydroxylating ferredoxin subunit